jgi:GT2 family glycosyltransferase
MFRRDLLLQLPEQKLADTFFMYAEDVQWCYQIKKLGYKVLYYPEAEVIHQLGGSDKQSQNNEEKYFSRLLPNMYKVLQMERGKLYACCTYLVKAIHLMSLRNRADWKKAKRYFSLIVKG